MATDTDVLIIGAGPTGLLLAYELGLAGMPALVLDKALHPDEQPRANGLVGQTARVLTYRGLLEDTLVLFGSEFGRLPTAQGPDGRDHNITGYPMWLAGAGVKPGFSHGATDEYGIHAVEGRMHTTDLHATLLWLLGMDHERLTFRHAGRDFRLTDVSGRVVKEIMT